MCRVDTHVLAKKISRTLLLTGVVFVRANNGNDSAGSKSIEKNIKAVVYISEATLISGIEELSHVKYNSIEKSKNKAVFKRSLKKCKQGKNKQYPANKTEIIRKYAEEKYLAWFSKGQNAVKGSMQSQFNVLAFFRDDLLKIVFKNKSRMNFFKNSRLLFFLNKTFCIRPPPFV